MVIRPRIASRPAKTLMSLAMTVGGERENRFSRETRVRPRNQQLRECAVP